MKRVLIGLIALVATVAPSAGEDAPSLPTATFEVEDGWVNVRLQRDGKPVPNTRLKVLVERQLWAEGEMGDEGLGTFPRPRGMYCQLVFDMGAGPAAPIPLNFLPDGTLVPTESPVRDGTAACCVKPASALTSSVPSDSSEAPTPPWWQGRWQIAAAVLGVNGSVLGWVYWRSRQASHTITAHQEPLT